MLRSGAECARDYMCDVVSAAPPIVSVGAGVVSVVVVVVVVVCSDGVVDVSSFLARLAVVNVRATRASDESARSFRILCVHLL